MVNAIGLDLHKQLTESISELSTNSIYAKSDTNCKILMLGVSKSGYLLVPDKGKIVPHAWQGSDPLEEDRPITPLLSIVRGENDSDE